MQPSHRSRLELVEARRLKVDGVTATTAVCAHSFEQQTDRICRVERYRALYAALDAVWTV